MHGGNGISEEFHVIRHMMNLSLSLDHRVVDGFVGAEFLRDVISHLENPALLD